MTLKQALNSLTNKYRIYGYSQQRIYDTLLNGIYEYGFSVELAYNGLRYALSQETGEKEYFTPEELAAIQGETPAEVISEITDYDTLVFFYPNGTADFKS